MTASGYSLESLSWFVQEASRRCGDKSSSGGLERERESPPPAADVQEERPPDTEERPPSPALDTAWESATEALEQGRVLHAIVTGWNRGGLLVRWQELQGFVPASQLREVPLVDGPEEREQKLACWIGEELKLKVIELDRERNRLVFSERATLWGPKDGDRVLEEIRPGDVRRGQVSNICDFGVFVDLGGVDGLIHLSELSWGRVSHPRDVLSFGDLVDVHVINVDKANRRIALSLKRLKPDPWSVVDEQFQVGQVVEATVSNVVAFGAFAQLEEGLEGLIHISELCDSKVAHPSEVVTPGETVSVRILRIDSVHHRLGLSMRLAKEQTPPVASDESTVEANWSTGATLLY